MGRKVHSCAQASALTTRSRRQIAASCNLRLTSNVRQRVPRKAMSSRFVTARLAPGSKTKPVLLVRHGSKAPEPRANTMKYREPWSPSARAVRPSAASEPIEVTFTKYQTPACRSASTGAGVARVGLSMRILVLRAKRFSPGKQPKCKHNTVMASASAASPRFGGFVVTGQRHRPLSGSEPKTLPNPSVEPTKCSKLHFAAHLER